MPLLNPDSGTLQAIVQTLTWAYEGWVAERWLADGVDEAVEGLAEYGELSELGADATGRWVTWVGNKVRDPREIRRSEADALERIEIRSEWQTVEQATRNPQPHPQNVRTHLRAVAFEDGQEWPASVHVHAALDPDGRVGWAGLRTFRDDEDPTPPAEATLDIECDDRVDVSAAWLAAAAAERYAELRGERQEDLPPRHEPPRWSGLPDGAAAVLSAAADARTAETWLNGSADGQDLAATRGGRLEEIRKDRHGRSIRWNGHEIRTASELTAGDPLPRWIGPAVLSRETGGDDRTQLEIRLGSDAAIRGEVRDGVLTDAWIGTRRDDQPREWRRLAHWIAERRLGSRPIPGSGGSPG